MTHLPKKYNAKTVDAKWYDFWENHGLFKPDPSSSKNPYTIIMPPPNVTGVLHMGHALVDTLQDILIRWKRMLGYDTLWVPGTDHAGIATQTVVERHLIKTQEKKRKDFSREEFLKHVWKWKEDNEHSIITQVKKLGCSCDWSRLCFTMDAIRNRAVHTMFKKLYDAGLIYRGDYLVNWDPVTQTALADDEVEYEERQSHLWTFKYPLKDESGYVTIATTRPETMLGDTAIAVSPKDNRHKHLIGKTVILPLMERKIPIIADHLVDPEFGTGMVKVTPAHDPNDYQMGITHNLPFINIMTPDGKINEKGGQFVGLSMLDARDAVVKEMEKQGFLEKIEPHTNRVGVSYRSKAVIEPWMSKQWFVRITDFKDNLKEAVRTGKTKLIPKHWENTYYHWIDNLRDWCISRQLWWGHRIPIWYNKKDPEKMICHIGEDLPPEVAASPDAWQQDEDVLDTWFSSSLWPFSTMGWPEDTEELNKYYPNSILVTGHDILFFWVARMLLMGEYTLGTLPFPEVFLHGLIYGKSYWRKTADGGITYVNDDERRDYDLGNKPIPKDVQFKWEKMSKSKGNIINPIEIIDDYGTDAMRMALCASAPQSREIDLDRRRFEEFRNFTNKIWNGARFVFMNLDGDDPLTSEQFSSGLNETIFSLEDHWILSVLNDTIDDVNKKLDQYAFDQAAMEAYDFYWRELCSYYLEITKPVLFGKEGTPEERKNKQKLLVIAISIAMRLIHPMAPFISEELFQLLKERYGGAELGEGIDPYTKETLVALNCSACIVAPYPTVIRKDDINEQINSDFKILEEMIYAIRNIRGEMKVPPGYATDLHIIGNHNLPFIQKNNKIIKALVKVNTIHFHTEEPHLPLSSMAIVQDLKVIIPLPEEMVKKEADRLSKEQKKLYSTIEKLHVQLSNEAFVENAPPHLIEQQRNRLEKTKLELDEIEKKLQTLEVK